MSRLPQTLLPALLFVTMAVGAPLPAVAQATQQCFVVEFFYDSNVDEAAGLRKSLDAFVAARPGITVTYRDVQTDQSAKGRLASIAKYFRTSEIQLPALYGMKYIVAGVRDEQQMQQRLRQMFTLTAYVRNGCAHCRAAKAFLRKYESRYPGLQIVYREISDSSARADMNAVVKRYNQRAASVPVLHFCNGVSIGYDRDTTTGRRILKTLDFWSKGCSAQKKTGTVLN